MNILKPLFVCFAVLALASMIFTMAQKSSRHDYHRPYALEKDTFSQFDPELFQALEEADIFEFMTLDSRVSYDKEKVGERKRFHGYEILGQQDLKDVNERASMVDYVYEAAQNRSGRKAACFRPRHALRLTRGAQVVDILICFECSRAVVYGKSKTNFLLKGSAEFFNSIAIKYEMRYELKKAIKKQE
jgi:hypothetical protein